MSFRYIGSKARLVDAILTHLGPPNGGSFVDAFCGTGVVAEAAARRGWPVLLNDHLHSAVVMAAARLVTAEQAPFTGLGGYAGALATLNAVPRRKGFIWAEYSPGSAQRIGFERRYFTEHNAQKIDAIRAAIGRWRRDRRINAHEERLLIGDLLGAANRAANTAGTYGCFLSKWQRQALEPIALHARTLATCHPKVRLSATDAKSVPCSAGDVVYLDPPYTKRQYAAYYHILETIAAGDRPKVEGVCGIRPWRQMASDYCYRTRAVGALHDLVQALPARRMLLSYSTEGHVPLDSLAEALAPLGTVTMHALMQVGRYRPNTAASKAGSGVGEFLIGIERDAQSLGVAA